MRKFQSSFYEGSELDNYQVDCNTLVTILEGCLFMMYEY